MFGKVLVNCRELVREMRIVAQNDTFKKELLFEPKNIKVVRETKLYSRAGFVKYEVNHNNGPFNCCY